MTDPTHDLAALRLTTYAVGILQTQAEKLAQQAYQAGAQFMAESETYATLKAELEALASEASEWTEGSQEDYAVKVRQVMQRWYEERVERKPPDTPDSE